MIASFGDAFTEDLYHGNKSSRTRRFPANLLTVLLRKLDMLTAAGKLEDLKVPPGNRLEALKSDLRGFHSIRVNDQWRVVFRWESGGAHEVRVTDYH